MRGKGRFLMISIMAGLFCLCHDALADWGAAQRLTWTLGDSYSPATAAGASNTVHFVWTDYTPGNAEIYHKKSTDGGTTWSAAQRITWTAEGSYEPAIAIDSSNSIHVAWDDDTPGNYEIYYKKSTDGGTTWNAAQRLTWSSGWSEYPSVCMDSSDTIHVVWQDSVPGNLEIYHRRSTDGGTNWSATQRLTWTSGSSEYPAMAIDSNDAIHVVWSDDTPGNSELYYKRSADGGATWTAAQRLTWSTGGSSEPAVAMASNNAICVVWDDDTPSVNPELYHKKSPDGGITWVVSQRITWTTGASHWPAMATDSNSTIHVVWEDNTPGNYEIYGKKSTDGGTTWSVSQRLTWTADGSIEAAVTTDSSNRIHVFWEDSTPGNSEIYYKRGT